MTHTDPIMGPHSSSCTLCGFTGSASAFAGHTCSQTSQPQSIEYSALEIHDEPNRFDPYEALDTISRTATDSMNVVKDGVLQPVTDQMRLNTNLIGFEVHALRAYITGMER